MIYDITTPMAFLVNGALLILSLILALIMMNAGVMWSQNTGNNAVQAVYKRALLRALAGLIMIGLAGSVVNLFFV